MAKTEKMLNQFNPTKDADTAPRSERRALIWVVLVALGIRLIGSGLWVAVSLAVWANDPDNHWRYGFEMGRVAASLASGHGFSDPWKMPSGPTAWLPPVYPLIWAGVFKAFGIYSTASAVAIRVFNSVVSALTCVPVFYIARNFGGRAGIWAAWFWAFFPHGILAAAIVAWDSSLTALILSCLVWMTLELRKARPLSAWMGYGALWGLGGLTNATMLAGLPLLLGWLWWQRGFSLRKGMLRPAVTVLACFAAMAPWMVRNYRVFHQPFLVKSNFWLEFMRGNSVDQWTHTTVFMSTPEPAAMRFVEVGEMRYMAEKKAEALDFLRHHPGLYLWLCLRRFVYIWTGYWSFSPRFLAAGAHGGPMHIAFVSGTCLALLVGLWRAFRTQRELAFLLAAFVFSLPVATYVTHPFLWYRFIIDPEVVILAAYGTAPAVFFVLRKVRLLEADESREVATQARLFPSAGSPGARAAV